MAENHSAEQVRAAKLAAMPGPLGEISYALWNEVACLHMKWNDSIALFGTPERVAILNRAAPEFAYYLQRILWEDVVLHLCRLTDPPKSAGHANLTLQRLPPLIENPSLREEVDRLVVLAKEKTAFARERRNRRLAHKELPPLDGGHPEPLAPASREHVEDALCAIRAVMQAVERHFEQSDIRFECCESAQGGASLLFYLKKGLEAQERELNALRGLDSP